MRRTAAFLAAGMCLLAACSSSGSGKASSSTEPSTTVAPTEPSTTVAPTTTAAVTSTTAACHALGSTSPVTTSSVASAALLRAVQVTGERCADRVTFDFTTKANGTPKCTIAYDQPPFTMDGSGAPVTVAGSAFVRVRCEPAYGYDFETGQTTYTGPKRLTATGMQHVRELVETGDFEGVLNWIIGLDGQRPFVVHTAAVSGPQALKRLTIRFF